MKETVSARHLRPRLEYGELTLVSAEPADSAHLAQSVRRDTADLASYALSNRQPRARSGVLGRTSSHSPAVSETSTVGPAKYGSSTPDERHFRRASFSQIAPVFQSPASRAGAAQESPSMLTNLLRDSPSDNASHHDGATAFHDAASRSSSEGDREDLGDGDGGSGARLARESSRLETVPELDEQTPLISNTASKQSSERGGRSLGGGDLEAQGAWQPSALRRLRRQAGSRAAEFAAVLSSPRKWDGRAILRRAVVEPASYLPAVLVGLLLNVLDALSYGTAHRIGPGHGYTADLSRHDSVPTRKPNIFAPWIRGDLHLLREHHCSPDYLLFWEHLQGRRRVGTGKPVLFHCRLGHNVLT